MNTDEEKDKAGDSGEKNPLIEIRDSVPPLQPKTTKNRVRSPRTSLDSRRTKASGDWSHLSKVNTI